MRLHQLVEFYLSSSSETKIEDIRNCAKRLSVIGPVVLDEIYLLLQDVHRARQNLPDGHT